MKTNSKRTAAQVMGGILIAVGSAAQAQVLSVNVGSITLDGSPKDIFVQNLTASPVEVGTLQLNVQVTTVPGGANRPKITNVEIKSGTIFQAEPGVATGGFVDNFSWEIGFNDDGNNPRPTIGANQTVLLAQVTFDTTGVPAGSWGFSLSTGAGASEFYDLGATPIAATLTDGTLSVVPEPSTYATIFTLGSLAFAVARRRRAA